MSASTSSQALVPSILEGPKILNVKSMVLVALGVLCIAISAKIQIPFWPVPMTLQTMAIMAIFITYGLRLSLATIVSYFALGLLGLPVFAGAVAGPAYFIGPTAGFLAGFVLAAVIVGYTADRFGSRNLVAAFTSMLVADAVIFALGFLWLGFVFTTAEGNTLGGAFAFEKAVMPYLLSDFVKIILAALLPFAIVALLKRDSR